MYGAKSRKRQEQQAREADKAKRCACGNYCGADGLCNACRSSKSAGSASATKSGAGYPAVSAKPARPKLKASGKPGSRAEAASLAVISGCPDVVESDVIEYLADMAATMFEDGGATPVSASQDLEDSFLPLLEEYSVPASEAKALCDRVIEAVFPSSSPTTSTAAAQRSKQLKETFLKVTGQVDGELLCRVPDLMLMYGGSPEPLLRNATLEFVRGHRYGVVGSNGSGKTTLMERIASKNIVGLPKTLRVVHLRHDKILDGVDAKTTAKQYAQTHSANACTSSEEKLQEALETVGFDTQLLSKAVVALSGGWQMRLALACAMAQNANLLLLDEPTNHLDTAGVTWLADFITDTCVGGESGVTAMIVSHDPDFLDRVCTDVVLFSPEGKLVYHPGNFSEFKQQVLGGDDAKALQVLETSSSGRLGQGPLEEDRMMFPAPGRIGETVKERRAPVLTLRNAYFQYPDTPSPVLSDVDVQLTATCRVGMVGPNGSGKSTLLALLAGRLKTGTKKGGFPGELWCQKGVRLAYIAQHSMVHLGEHLAETPLEYLQSRFRRGFDAETPEVNWTPTAKEAEKLRSLGVRHGKKGKQVHSLLSRIEWREEESDERKCLYEVKWMDLAEGEKTFEPRERLKQLGAEGMMAALDEKLSFAWGGEGPRALKTDDIVKHFSSFGLSEDVTCNRKLSMLSSGQKCKVVLGAAFWTHPHIVCFDEPTNYLDVETVEMLGKAIHSFRGGCVLVTHNSNFLQEVCNEVWEVKGGNVTVQKQSKAAASTQ